jgi:hypothetical protein
MTDQPQGGIKPLRFFFVVLLIAVIWGSAIYLHHLNRSSVRSSSPPAEATKMDAPEKKQEVTVPNPGQIITIFNPQGNPVGVTRTASAFQELQKALEAHDEQGLTELTSSGQAYLVPSGTRAKFLDYGDGWSAPYEVRILDGEHAGERAFVYHRSVTE